MEAIGERTAAFAGRGAVDPSVGLDRLLLRMLDEMDYGVLLVDRQGRLRFSNRLGRVELGSDGPLKLVDGLVTCDDGLQRAALRHAVSGAAGGHRQLLEFRTVDATRSVAFAPIGDTEPHGAGAGEQVLMIFGKRPTRAEPAIDLFARGHGLTGTESAVLRQLAHGLEPAAIARRQGVALSTIRTQIASIRAKTYTPSVRVLLDRLALLPPVATVRDCDSHHLA